MPRTPTQWLSTLSPEDRAAANQLSDAIDKAMDRDNPSKGANNFVYNIPEGEHLPNARVEEEIRRLYGKTETRTDGWSKIEFVPSASMSFIRFEV